MPLVNVAGNPFADNNTEAFAYPTKIIVHWKQRRSHVEQRKLDISACGVDWNELGISFPYDWNFNSSVMKDTVRPILLSGDRLQRESGEISLRRFAARPHAAESPLRGPHNLHRLVTSLNRHGFARFGAELGFADTILRHDVPRLVDNAMVSKNPGHDEGGTNIPYLPSFEPTVEKAINTLGHVVLNYVGADAELSGYGAYRLGSIANAPPTRRDLRKYRKPITSTLWHHDRCGRRLKAYIFLQDVTAETHPTEIVAGSHRTVYYSYSEYFESRFDGDFVRNRYNATQMLGRLGDGFIFDTNTIHRGRPGEMRRRDVLVFEFNIPEELKAVAHHSGMQGCKPTASQPHTNFTLDRIRREHNV